MRGWPVTLTEPHLLERPVSLRPVGETVVSSPGFRDRVAGHGRIEAPVGLLHLRHGLRVDPAVGQRDLDLDVLAGLHALHRLPGVHLGRGAQDHRIDVVARKLELKLSDAELSAASQHELVLDLPALQAL